MLLYRAVKPGASVDQCCNLASHIPSKDLPFQIQCETDYLSFNPPGIGRYLVCMIAQAFVFFGIVIAVEARIVQSLINTFIKPPAAKHGLPDDEDEDVRAERHIVKRKVCHLTVNRNFSASGPISSSQAPHQVRFVFLSLF